MKGKWMVIVNPNAGIRSAEKLWPEIKLSLEKENLDFEVIFSQKKLETIDIAATQIEKGYRNIIAVGGDGTMNEVVSGIFKQKTCNPEEITLAQIPIGTGNDWGKVYSNPTDIHEAIRLISNGKRVRQDVGLIRYQQDDVQNERYFINIAGFGFDAKVAQKVGIEKDKGKNGKLAYLINLFTCLMGSGYYKCRFVVDERIIKERIFTMVAGNGRYNGNGMMQLPLSQPDDGLLDIVYIKEIGKLEVIANVKNLYDGSYLKNKKVRILRAKGIKVFSNPPIPVEADGEFLGFSPIEIELASSSIFVVVNDHELIINDKLLKYVPDSI